MVADTTDGVVLSGFGKIDRRPEIEVPGEEFFNAVDRMVRNTGEDVRQIGFRIDPVQFRRADQAVDCSGPLPADVGSSKQVVLTTQGHSSQSAFGGIVVDLQSAVVTIPK